MNDLPGSADAARETGIDEPISDDALSEVNDARDAAFESEYVDVGAFGDGGPCTGSLANVGQGCPGSYSDAFNSALTCQGWPGARIDGGYPWHAFAGNCAGLAAVGYYGGVFGWFTCFYDGVDGGTLVGAKSTSDTNSYCGGTADMISGGQLPVPCSTYFEPQMDLGMLDACAPADTATDATGDSSDATAD